MLRAFKFIVIAGASTGIWKITGIWMCGAAFCMATTVYLTKRDLL